MSIYPIFGYMKQSATGPRISSRAVALISIYHPDYIRMCKLLREFRERADMTQAELARRLAPTLGLTQSKISQVETGERRLDMVELRFFCHALGLSLPEFVAEFEARLADHDS
jgi:DNA-binding XRE family transcriptional regulator